MAARPNTFNPVLPDISLDSLNSQAAQGGGTLGLAVAEGVLGVGVAAAQVGAQVAEKRVQKRLEPLVEGVADFEQQRAALDVQQESEFFAALETNEESNVLAVLDKFKVLREALDAGSLDLNTARLKAQTILQEEITNNPQLAPQFVGAANKLGFSNSVTNLGLTPGGGGAGARGAGKQTPLQALDNDIELRQISHGESREQALKGVLAGRRREADATDMANRLVLNSPELGKALNVEIGLIATNNIVGLIDGLAGEAQQAINEPGGNTAETLLGIQRQGVLTLTDAQADANARLATIATNLGFKISDPQVVQAQEALNTKFEAVKGLLLEVTDPQAFLTGLNELNAEISLERTDRLLRLLTNGRPIQGLSSGTQAMFFMASFKDVFVAGKILADEAFEGGADIAKDGRVTLAELEADPKFANLLAATRVLGIGGEGAFSSDPDERAAQVAFQSFLINDGEQAFALMQRKTLSSDPDIREMQFLMAAQGLIKLPELIERQKELTPKAGGKFRFGPVDPEARPPEGISKGITEQADVALPSQPARTARDLAGDPAKAAAQLEEFMANQVEFLVTGTSNERIMSTLALIPDQMEAAAFGTPEATDRSLNTFKRGIAEKLVDLTSTTAFGGNALEAVGGFRLNITEDSFVVDENGMFSLANGQFVSREELLKQVDNERFVLLRADNTVFRTVTREEVISGEFQSGFRVRGGFGSTTFNLTATILPDDTANSFSIQKDTLDSFFNGDTDSIVEVQEPRQIATGAGQLSFGKTQLRVEPLSFISIPPAYLAAVNLAGTGANSQENVVNQIRQANILIASVANHFRKTNDRAGFEAFMLTQVINPINANLGLPAQEGISSGIAPSVAPSAIRATGVSVESFNEANELELSTQGSISLGFAASALELHNGNLPANMRISPNIVLGDMSVNSINDPNVPQTAAAITAMSDLAVGILEPVIQQFGDITITSGFRNDAVNTAAGGVGKSQHKAGQAVDFFVPGGDLVEVANFIEKNFEFDQLIIEFDQGIIHVSQKKKGNRNQRLIQR